MKMIISPAKKMNEDTDSIQWRDLPVFLYKTEELARELKSKSYDELKKLWKCNDKIAALNAERLANMDLKRRLTPALLAYEGIQYQYMAPSVFSEDEFDYIADHLRILSGFYGVLRPFDGIVPYRLEMQAALKMKQAKDLYEFWGANIAAAIFADTDTVINLASKEYSMCVTRHKPRHARVINCVFGEKTGDKVVEKGTMCKMARGAMVRFMAERNVREPEELKGFDRLDYCYCEGLSNDENYVFLLKK